MLHTKSMWHSLFLLLFFLTSLAYAKTKPNSVVPVESNYSSMVEPAKTETVTPPCACVAPKNSYSRAKKFGIRLTGMGGAYASAVNNTANQTQADLARVEVSSAGQKTIPDYTKYVSAGWMVPLQLEMTYSFTDAFELLLGARYGFSGTFVNSDKYLMNSFGLALGGRYYFNAQDAVQAYMSAQAGIDLTQFVRVEGVSGVGFLFNITPRVGLFLEGNLLVSALYNSDASIGKGLQVGAGLGTGLHVRF